MHSIECKDETLDKKGRFTVDCLCLACNVWYDLILDNVF